MGGFVFRTVKYVIFKILVIEIGIYQYHNDGIKQYKKHI